MLKKKTEKKLDPLLIEGTNSVRRMMMNRGYYIRDIIAVSEKEIDLFGLKEGLINSELIRIRLVFPDKTGGLGIDTARKFFKEQARVNDLGGILISLNPLSQQAIKYAGKHGYNLFGPDWLIENSDFDPENLEMQT